MKRLAAGFAGALLLTAGLAAMAWAAPKIEKDGKLAIPADVAGWPVAGTTYALSYEGNGSTTFNTVRIDPASYAAYLKTGNFPAGTMMDLDVRASQEEVAPAKGGHTQGKSLGRSMHVKDEKAGPGTWTFYNYANGAAVGTPIARDQACYTCHEKEAKQDTAFTQFYPSLLDARAKASGGK